MKNMILALVALNVDAVSVDAAALIDNGKCGNNETFNTEVCECTSAI